MIPHVPPQVPMSWGELIDKLTILELKRDRIVRASARANVAAELDMLRVVAAPALREAGVARHADELRAVNAALWDIEDAIRREEAAARFGAEFVALARAVYRHNDERAAIKRRINLALASPLIEEKSYAEVGAPAG